MVELAYMDSINESAAAMQRTQQPHGGDEVIGEVVGESTVILLLIWLGIGSTLIAETLGYVDFEALRRCFPTATSTASQTVRSEGSEADDAERSSSDEDDVPSAADVSSGWGAAPCFLMNP